MERAALAAKKVEERDFRRNKRCAPKAIAPSTAKKTKVAPGESSVVSDSSTVSAPSTSRTSSLEAETEAASSKPSRPRKADHSRDKNSDSFDENQCCVCFRTYEDDVIEDTCLDWLQCACKRWLHEECIDYDIGHNADGYDLLCPFCCV